jgi:hypothetical protein
MHRAAFHFIKALGVSSQVTRTGKHKEVGNTSGNIGDEEADDTDIDTSMDFEASANDAEAMAETLIVDFEPGDTIGKLLAFVNQVRVSSEDVREYLAHSCHMHSIKAIELRLWVRSRWGSLSHCLSATIEVQKVCWFFFLCPLLSTNIVLQAIDYFCVTADSNEDLPPLKGKLWSDYRLQGGEWKLIKLVHNCLKVGFLLVLSPSSYPSLRSFRIDIMNYLTRNLQHAQECYRCWSSSCQSGRNFLRIKSMSLYMEPFELVYHYWRNITAVLMIPMYTLSLMVCIIIFVGFLLTC